MTQLHASDAQLTAHLHRLRAQEFDLRASQTRCLAAIDLAAEFIRHEPRLDVDDPQDPTQKVKDRRYVELLELFDKVIEAQVKVPE